MGTAPPVNKSPNTLKAGTVQTVNKNKAPQGALLFLTKYM
jgi:hypothetical protein